MVFKLSLYLTIYFDRYQCIYRIYIYAYIDICFVFILVVLWARGMVSSKACSRCTNISNSETVCGQANFSDRWRTNWIILGHAFSKWVTLTATHIFTLVSVPYQGSMLAVPMADAGYRPVLSVANAMASLYPPEKWRSYCLSIATVFRRGCHIFCKMLVWRLYKYIFVSALTRSYRK